MHAVKRTSCLKSEKFFGFNSLLSNTWVTLVRTILHSSFVSLDNVSIPGTRAGQFVSFSKTNCGLSFHTLLSASSETLIPRVAKSAGLSYPGTCLHCSGFVEFWISPILLAMKVLKLRLWFFPQYRTFVESVQ
jgi:hypothetical protein